MCPTMSVDSTSNAPTFDCFMNDNEAHTKQEYDYLTVDNTKNYNTMQFV